MLDKRTISIIVEGIADAMSPDSAFVPAPGNGISEKSVSAAFTDVIKWLNDKSDSGKAEMSFDTYKSLVGMPKEIPADREEDAQKFYEAVNLRLAEYAERNGIRFLNYGGGDGIEIDFLNRE